MARWANVYGFVQILVNLVHYNFVFKGLSIAYKLNYSSWSIYSMRADEICMLFHRYVSAQRYSEALDILQSGACIQLKHGRVVFFKVLYSYVVE